MPVHYLGFTRAPPPALSSSQTIVVAPTITNDLRDEVYTPDQPISIAVVWLLEAPQNAQGSRGPGLQELQIIKHEEPIEWTGPSTAWKNATFTVPSSDEVHRALSRIGEAQLSAPHRMRTPPVRLALWVSEDASRSATRPPKAARHRHRSNPGNSSAAAHDLEDLCIDPQKVSQSMLQARDVFLPVLTPPISLHDSSTPSSSASASAKLTQFSRLWRLGSHGIEGDILEVLENNTFDLDKHVWDASLPMISCLLSGNLARPAREDPAHTAQSGRLDAWQQITDVLHSSQDVVILELGAGTGLLSLCLHRHLSALPKEGQHRPRRCRIFATDLEESTAFTATNLSLNGITPPPSSGDQGEEPTPCLSTSPDPDAPSLPHTTTSVLPLDWFDADLPRELRDALSESRPDPPQDNNSGERPASSARRRPDLLILASDCSYNPDTYDAFCAVLRRLFTLYAPASTGKTQGSAQPSGPRCLGLVSKKHRHEDEGRLWEVLRSTPVAAGGEQPVRLEATLLDGWPGPGFDHDADGDEGDDDEGKWGIFAVSAA